MTARVVQLVQHVGADAPGAPLAVVDLGPGAQLNRHVIRVDLSGNAVEEDAALPTDPLRWDPSRQQPRRQLFDDRSPKLAPRLLAPVRDLERRREEALRMFLTVRHIVQSHR